jgi:hypothetical protein
MACWRAIGFIFVCHSMGGIVVRKYIVERQAELIEAGKEIDLFLVASPSLGSTYADWLSPLAQLFGHAQAGALRFVRNNNWLMDLDKEFMNLKEGGTLRIEGKELVEDKFIELKKIKLGIVWGRQVVEPFSGARYFGEPYKVPKSDHFSIAKPDDKNAIQHRLLSGFVSENAHSPQPETRKPPPDPDRPPIPADISRIIKYAPAQLIGREAETRRLNEAWAKAQNNEMQRPHVLTFVAVGGEGKTSLMAKWAADLAYQNWVGCDAAFAWSFYSQGAREEAHSRHPGPDRAARGNKRGAAQCHLHPAKGRKAADGEPGLGWRAAHVGRPPAAAGIFCPAASRAAPRGLARRPPAAL